MITALDRAHAAMLSGGDAEARGFYRLLADAPLFLLLDREAEGERIHPRVFDLSEGPILLAFDTEDRLAGLGLGPVPYAQLPGRIIAQHLAGQGVSLGLNLNTGAASETMLPAVALRHLNEMLDVSPQETEAVPEAFAAPGDLPLALEAALRFTLDGAAGLAVGAVLAGVQYRGGRRGHMLAIVDAIPQAQEPLARAVAEAMVFAGIEAGEIDVTFLAADDPALVAIARVGRLYEVPLPEAPAERAAPEAPGSNPDKPPRLR